MSIVLLMFSVIRSVVEHLERLRDARGGQKPSSFPFGILGFVKSVLLEPWKGQRLVLCSYLGMRYVTGEGVLVYPVNQHSNGKRDVIRGHSFRKFNLMFKRFGLC